MAQLQFKGKTFVQNHHLLVKYHELVPVKEKSLTDKVSLHDNLIIHGDNLKALKALLPLYAGKIKCIYIDPPYNTGNENWAYNDNVNSPMMQEWLGKVVDREDLTRHDKWLCMMMPRLKLLRELMAEGGVIFISIDDNEVHHLRMLMDEIFGEHNFIATVIWEKVYSPKSTAKYFSENHDFIVVYAKSKPQWEIGLLPRTSAQDARYSNPDQDPRGDWKPGDLSARNPYSKGKYSIKCPGGRMILGPPPGNYWRYSEDSLRRLDKDRRIWWGEDANQVPAIKRFLSEVKQGLVPETIWTYGEVGHTQEAKKELLQIFPNDYREFTTLKPTKLIERILRLSTDPEEETLVLDSFAGTAPSAQATLSLNAKDGGNRRFILVECEDYADSITAERVRRVIIGAPQAKDEALRNGLGGTFSFFELGKPIELESILEGPDLPTYNELARYVFYTATGEEFDDSAVNRETRFIGESRNCQVFLFYEPDIEKLKSLALTLEVAEALPPLKPDKRRLVFAPTKYLDQDHLDRQRIDFAQLPFEIYELTR
ncbi:MAG: site-specific DNA-methyltransferase [Chloroflexi bacterium]|nr:site-specific DNA-methyltransferase [Chloroflexota bacterium]